VYRTAINSDYFKKIRVKDFAFCIVKFFFFKKSCLVERVSVISFMPAGKLQLPMHHFSRNLNLNSILSMYLKPNVIEIRQ